VAANLAQVAFLEPAAMWVQVVQRRLAAKSGAAA